MNEPAATSERTRHARVLFDSIAPTYERMGRVLSLGFEASWRRFLVSRMRLPAGSLVLDVASGTGLVARELAATWGVRVLQLEPSERMLRAGGGTGASAPVPVLGRAEHLPFADASADGLTFTYLLRYVDDPPATLRELARVVKPGGIAACLEFHVPDGTWARAGWGVYTSTVLPLLGATASTAWFRTARFLGPSIERFYREHPLPAQIRWWHDAGFEHVRTRTFLFGSAIVISAVRRNDGR